MQVSEIMSKDVVTVPSDAPVAEAAREMRDRDIGDVIVADGGRPTGIVTDRDIAIRVVAEGQDPSSTTVRDCCSGSVMTVLAADDTDVAVRTMREKAIRRLPVVEDDGRLVGVVSLGDLAIEVDRRSALADISAAPADQ